MRYICHRVTRAVLYQANVPTFSDCVLKAIRARVDLANADLRRVNLEGRDLSMLDAINADMTAARLRNTNLGFSILSGAILRNADLRGACLENAILSSACLFRANFRHASLVHVDLSLAEIRQALFDGADISQIIAPPGVVNTLLSMGAHTWPELRYTMHGTRTGRFSSTQPNLSNIPRAPNAPVRWPYMTPPGAPNTPVVSDEEEI